MSARRHAATLVAVLAVAVVSAGSVEAQPLASSTGAAPSVTVMIVGSRNTILTGARLISASAARVRVGSRMCAVASGTPLAALVAVRRAGGPRFALRDYGRCGASAADSAELFVSSLGGEANRGQNGWEYKVGGLSGSTGAADPSGPAGDGHRLRTGAQLLWFWCQASAGGCQRSLEVRASAARAAPSRSQEPSWSSARALPPRAPTAARP